MTLEIGKFYWVAGQGPMLLMRSEFPHTIRLHNYNGFNYWATEEQVGDLSSPEEATAFVEECKLKGVLPKDFVPNWEGK